ncbi:MAG: hypothetical protein ABIN58_06340 [candidate division WOR-3 bacterium]
MKIKSDEVSRQIIREQIQKGLGQKGAKFDEVLQQTMQTTEAAARKAESSQAASDIQPSSGIIPDERQKPILDRIEQLLDTLEEYQRSLGTSNISSDALQTIVARMEEHNRDLAVILVGLPDGDNLKELLNRVLVTSVVEVEKFKRGDYS